MNRLIMAVLTVAGFSVSAFAQDDEKPTMTMDDMVKVETTFQETWINPNFEPAQYSKLYLWESYYEYRDVGPARKSRTTMMSTHKREFGISDKDRQKFEEVVEEAFVKEIQKIKNLQLVDQPGPDTLLMRGAIVDIVSNVPPEYVGRSEVYLATIGEGTFVLELLDGETGISQAIVAERRAIKSGTGRIDQFSMPTNSATVIAEVKRWARSAAAKLRKELDEAVAGR